MARYAIVDKRGEPYTYQGAIITHTDRSEMEWLFPNTRVVRVTDGASLGRVLPLPAHPRFREQGIRFPLDRSQFAGH